MDTGPRLRAYAAEFIGTAGLLAAVVGSGIMGARLSGGNVALALLANSLATGLALSVLILVLGPVSGAHFNPVVSGLGAARGQLEPVDAAAYIVCQLLGAFVGVLLANMMFGEPFYAWSSHSRRGPGQLLGEGLATFGLLLAVVGASRRQPTSVPYVVGAYIAAAYWWTSSTSFANPAATLARAATDTFTGIRLADVPGFVAAQAAGAALALPMSGWLVPDRKAE